MARLDFCRKLIALAGFGAATVTATSVQAQTVELTSVSPERVVPLRADDRQPNWISRDDCIKDDVLTFQVKYTGVSGQVVEVWAGRGSATCTESAQRSGNAPNCWLVYEGAASGLTVPIRARDIVAEHKPTEPDNGPGSGTVDDCRASGSVSTPIEITLWFMLFSSDLNVENPPNATYDKLAFDLIGPPAPTGVKVGLGENQLIVSWKDPGDNADIHSYQLYCDPPPGGGTATASFPQGTDAGVDAGGTAGSAGSAGTAGAAGTGATAGTSGAAGRGGSAGAAGSGTTTTGTSCLSSSVLTPGAIPDETYEPYRCGNVTTDTATEGKATGLQNFVEHGVGVAAVDDVGNAGPLSSVVCGTPEPVDDFYELYSRAGGKGGGGFCSLGGAPVPAWWALLLAAACAAIWRRWGRG